jgi:glutaredoxin
MQFNRKNLLLKSLCWFMLFQIYTASAQDFGGIFRGVLQNKTKDLINSAFKSLSEVSFGQIPNNASVPVDATNKIVLYSTSTCPYCKQATSYLQRKNIGYIERILDSNRIYQEEYRNLGGKGVPFIVFEQKTMNGFTEKAFETNFPDILKIQADRASGSTEHNATIISEKTLIQPQSGDIFLGKISGVKVYGKPDKSSKQISTLSKLDEVIYMGEEQSGYYRVTCSNGEGWVDKLLVKKQ